MPPDYAAEMVPFDPLVGEFRVHYAGFFDPGFGYEGAGGRGARAVLEVRSREVPFILEHGQIVGRLVYEKMLARPDDALRHGHRLELPGAGPEAVEALPGVGALLARFSRSVLPSYALRKRPRRCSSGTRKSTTLSRSRGVACGCAIMKPPRLPVASNSSSRCRRSAAPCRRRCGRSRSRCAGRARRTPRASSRCRSPSSLRQLVRRSRPARRWCAAISSLSSRQREACRQLGEVVAGVVRDDRRRPPPAGSR